MASYYLLLDLGSLLIPLVFSLSIGFFRRDQWKALLMSTTAVAIPFLIWDIWFTHAGIWGFNPNYHLEVSLLGLPLEEVLFFFCIPFASLFIHFCFERYLPSIGRWRVGSLSVLLIGSPILITGLWNWSKWYTFVDLSLAGLLLLYTALHPRRRSLLARFLPAYAVILIPFFLVNGALTGGFTEAPVVWYNDLENLGLRLGTVPIEDTLYAFSMLFGNLLIYDRITGPDAQVP